MKCWIANSEARYESRENAWEKKVELQEDTGEAWHVGDEVTNHDINKLIETG